MSITTQVMTVSIAVANTVNKLSNISRKCWRCYIRDFLYVAFLINNTVQTKTGAYFDHEKIKFENWSLKPLLRRKNELFWS